MGGSSGGGGSGGGGQAGMYSNYSRQMLAQQQRIGGELEGLAKDPRLVAMSQGQLSPEEMQWMNAQQNAVAEGQIGAQQGVEQTVREQATGRGVFSSRGAIAQEAGQVGNLAQTYAGQKASIYGQMADLTRQGVLQGMGLRQGLLNNASGMYGQVGAGYGGLSAGIMQNAQLRQQQAQQQQQGTMSSALGAGNLIGSFFK